MMGVNNEVFWTLNPKSLSPYVKAFELKQINEDRQAWLEGYYIQLAIASSFDKTKDYPKEPFMTKKVVGKKMDAENKMNKIKENFLATMVVINQNFTKGENVDG